MAEQDPQRGGDDEKFTVYVDKDQWVISDNGLTGRKVDVGHVPELHEYGDGETGYMSVQRARRVAAVWNACKGIPTEELEEVASSTMILIPWEGTREDAPTAP